MNPVRGLKRLSRMVFSRYPTWNWSFWPSSPSAAEITSRVGDGTSSSTVMAPVLWICRTFPEAPPMLWEQLENGQEEKRPDHPLLRLLQRPNPFYEGPELWWATMLDYYVDGNAYWIKIRNGAGVPVELWWVPHWTMEPKGSEKDDSVFIDHYEYKPGGLADTVKVLPEDVVHFRCGLDTTNIRKGYSGLKSVLSEIYTDDEAAAFTAALLRNMGVPGLIVSPESAGSPPTRDDILATKEYLKTAFSGEKRGEPLVMSGPTKVEQFGFSPEQLLLKELRRIPEERVTAVLGIPAMVAGLGAGLDRSTFTNMAEAREAAYESGIIPTQRIIAEKIRFQLLTDFAPDVWTRRFGFDLSKVRVLADDEDKIAKRMGGLVRDGIAMVSEGRRATGLEVDETRDNVFLRQMNLVQVPGDGSESVPLTPMNGNGNGNGNGDGGAADQEREMVAQAVARELERTGAPA